MDVDRDGKEALEDKVCLQKELGSLKDVTRTDFNPYDFHSKMTETSKTTSDENSNNNLSKKSKSSRTNPFCPKTLSAEVSGSQIKDQDLSQNKNITVTPPADSGSKLNDLESFSRKYTNSTQSSLTKFPANKLLNTVYNSASNAPVDLLVTLMRKVLVYGSKLENLKLELLSTNPNFKIDKLFQTFSQGRSTLNEEALIHFFHSYDLFVSITTARFFITYLKRLARGPGRSDREALNMIQFGMLFLPVSQNTLLFMPNIGIVVDSNRSIDPKQTLQTKSEFYLAQEILMIWLRKFQDISRTLSLIQPETHESMFALIAGDSGSSMNWITVSSFLEANSVKFLEEDIIHIFKEMGGQNISAINFRSFKAY